MNYLFITLIVILNLYGFACFAKEEPAKTQKEKQDKVKQKTNRYIAKIKSGTAWNYPVTDGKISEIKFKVEYKEFDNIGNLLSVSDYKNDILICRTQYLYNSGNDMLSATDFTSQGILQKKTTYKYDKDGRVISGESIDWNNIVLNRFENKFNKAKKTIESFNFHKKDSLEYTLIYKYKDDYDKWDFLEMIKISGKGDQLMKVENKFNFQKQLIEKKYTETDDKSSYTIGFQYNSKNEIQEITMKKADGSVEWKESYIYEERGNLYEVKRFDSKENLILYTRYTYEFYK